MRVITEKGLRKNLEKMAIVGKSESDLFLYKGKNKSSFYQKNQGEIGVLLEDDVGFYISVHEKIEHKEITELFHVRRISDEDIIAIVRSPKPWAVYWVDLSTYKK